jgi:glutathione S-transferase
MEPIVIVTLIALIQYTIFSVMVGRARAKAGIEAPAVVGDPSFERYFRVQQNTLEQLVVFLPALWLFGIYVDVLMGAAVGLLFVIGRVIYCREYVADPTTRALGFVMGMIAQTILTFGALIGAFFSWYGY